MKVVLFGATGMIGRGVLLECLDDPVVRSIRVVGRSPCGVAHAKVQETLHGNLFDCSPIAEQLADFDACFFCLGISAAGMREEAYHRITHDLTLAVAETLARQNPGMTFCYVSAAGADSTEQGRIMWARVKGRTENALMRLPFEAAYMFRPGYIQPLRGIRSRTRLYRAVYHIAGSLYPLWKALFPRYVTTTTNVGRAMIHVARGGYPRPVLETTDINAVAEDERSRGGP